jgi:uncharacterized FlaG/YvyC family protein
METAVVKSVAGPQPPEPAPPKHSDELAAEPVAQAAEQSDAPETIESQIESFKRALDEHYGNSVSFEASGSGSQIHFRVIDRETGRIVREFPRDDVGKLKNELLKGGILVSGSV